MIESDYRKCDNCNQPMQLSGSEKIELKRKIQLAYEYNITQGQHTNLAYECVRRSAINHLYASLIKLLD